MTNIIHFSKHVSFFCNRSLINDNFNSKEHIRVVCVSDTHNQTSKMTHDFPDGDILIHAGDFSEAGHISEVISFNKWLGTLPHKHKIVIAGKCVTFQKCQKVSKT